MQGERYELSTPESFQTQPFAAWTYLFHREAKEIQHHAHVRKRMGRCGNVGRRGVGRAGETEKGGARYMKRRHKPAKRSRSRMRKPKQKQTPKGFLESW